MLGYSIRVMEPYWLTSAKKSGPSVTEETIWYLENII